MAHLEGPRLESPAYPETGSQNASTSLISLNGSLAACAAVSNEPQELLGLSTGPSPMSIISSNPRASKSSSGSAQQLYRSDNSSEYNFPQDLELPEQQASQRRWQSFGASEKHHEHVADPLQRLASAEPQQQPWNGIHLNPLPPSQDQQALAPNSSSASRTYALGRQRSTVTDEGYYTVSHPDLHSVFSGDSRQMPRPRIDPATVPRSMVTSQGPHEFPLIHPNNVYGNMDFPPGEPVEQQLGSREAQPELFPCSESNCQYTFKTASELKKHVARHTREFVCDQDGCSRKTRGFATINDKERHQMTVHHIAPSHGQLRMYKCFSRNCKHVDKEWPRFDNFKSHLTRMHKSESTQALISRSNLWYEKERTPSQGLVQVSGPGSQWQDASRPGPGSDQQSGLSSTMQSRHLLSPTWEQSRAPRVRQETGPNRPRNLSLTSYQPSSFRPASLVQGPTIHQSATDEMSSNTGRRSMQASMSGVLAQPLASSSFNLSRPPPHGRPGSAYTVPNPDTSTLSELSEASFPSAPAFPSTQDDLAHIGNFSTGQHNSLPGSDHDIPSPSTSPSRPRPCLQPAPLDMEVIRALIRRSGFQEDPVSFQKVLMAGLEKLSEDGHSSAVVTATSSSTSVTASALNSGTDSTNASPYLCCRGENCTKTFTRPCDLTKHMKRHHRPYGCTFPKCFHKFGSKSDWKRHENYQHFQQECWKCALCAGHAQTRTSQLYYKRQHFQSHLQSAHTLSADSIKQHVRKQRIGRDCLTRFWCGFCGAIQELERKGLEGANERFNHIDKHFQKGQEISTWVEVDSSLAKGSLKAEGEGEGEEEEEEEEEENVENMLDAAVVAGPGDADSEGDEVDDSSADWDSGVGVPSGQPPARSSDADISSSQSGERPSKRRHTGSQVGSSPPSRAAPTWFFMCHGCGDGPWMLEHGQKCASCPHLYCDSCTLLDQNGTAVRTLASVRA